MRRLLKAEEKKEEESKKGIVLDEKTMKVVTLLVLLVSDFDFLLTIVSVTSYFFAAGIFYLFLGLIGAFFMIYIGGCIIAARESGKFIDRFKEKVDGNEIQGISTEDLNAALEGARIFWKGTVYEDWKKREACLKQLRLANDNLDTQQMTKDDCDILDAQLKEAEISGLALLVKKDMKNKNRFDDTYGQRMIDQYAAKLKEGRDALAAREGGAAGDAHVPLKPPPGNASGAAGGDAADEEEIDPAIKAFHKEIDEARDPPKDKKGKTIGAPDDLLALNLEKVRAPPRPPYPPFPPPSPPPATLVSSPPRPLSPSQAMRGELDTFRVPSKLLNDEGKIADQGDVGRALYMVCEAKGLLGSYHTVSRQFSRRIVKPAHSVPFYRLMEFGWQPSVSHSDFAGILNANGLYSFTVGIPQLMFAIAFLASQGTPVEFLCAAKDPNLPPVEGCPADLHFPGTHWKNGTACAYIPPSECRGPYETCFQNRAPPASGIFGADGFDASGELCDPTTFDVDELKADGSRRFEVGTTCGVGSCNEVQGPGPLLAHALPRHRQVHADRGLHEADRPDGAYLLLLRDRDLLDGAVDPQHHFGLPGAALRHRREGGGGAPVHAQGGGGDTRRWEDKLHAEVGEHPPAPQAHQVDAALGGGLQGAREEGRAQEVRPDQPDRAERGAEV